MGDANNNPKPSARPQVHYVSGRGYAVVGPDGQQMTGIFSDKNKALMALESIRKKEDERAKRGTRTCMCCRHRFESEGIHNRMCNSCRHRDVAPCPFQSSARRPAVARAAG